MERWTPASTRWWLRLHGALWLLMAALVASEAYSGLSRWQAGGHASYGVDLAPSAGLSQFRGEQLGVPVLRLQANPPAQVEVGDRLVFSPPARRWQIPQPGERVEVMRLRDGLAPQPVQLLARQQPVSGNEALDYLGRLALALPALLFGLLVARHQPENRAYRCLALGFTLAAGSPFLNTIYLGPAAWQSAVLLLGLALYPLMVYLLTCFTLHYERDPGSRLAGLLSRLVWPLRLLVALACLGVAHALLRGPLPGLTPLLALSIGGCQAVAILALLDAHRHSQMQQRQRLRWLLSSFAVGLLPVLVLMLRFEPAWFMAGPVQGPLLLFFGSTLLSYLLLGYAVLRHRVFDFEFVLDRALVYGVALVLLLGGFAIVKHALEVLLGAWLGIQQHWLLNNLLIAATYVAGHFTFERLDHHIRAIVYRRRLQRLAALRRFAQEALHFSSQQALLRGLHQALEAFTEQAGCVIYLRLSGGSFAQVFNSLPGASHLLDADDPLLVRLRASPTSLALADLASETSGARGALALPMLRRGQLAGVVLVGAKAQSDGYRADDVEAMQEAVHQVALDLQAIAAAKWEREGLDPGSSLSGTAPY